MFHYLTMRQLYNKLVIIGGKEMSIVVNNVVKMEWDTKRFLQTKAAKGKEPVFILACKEYDTKNGIIPVFFNPYHAWVHYDEDGVFTFADMLENVSGSSYDRNFPENAEEYHPLFSIGEPSANMSMLKKFGLEEYAEDIEARLRDVAPYGEEKDVVAG